MTRTAAAGTAGAASEAAPHPHRWAALCVMLTALFMNLLDVTIITVALPAMREGLGSGYAASQWFLTSYTLAFGAGVITGGRLGDRFGRRRLFLLGVVCFTLASTACGIAPDAALMIAARTVQGAAAALMVPQVMATVYAVFPLRERGAASGAFGAVTGFAGVAGPVLGGVFVTYDLAGLGWRAIFLVNVPLGLATLVAAALVVPDTRAKDPLRMDVWGVVLLTGGLLCALYPLVQGRDAGWPGWMRVSLVAAPCVLALYALHARAKDRRDHSALVPLRLFSLPGFGAGTAVLFTVHVVMIGFFVAVSLALQMGLGYSALRTGLVFLPWALGGALAAQLMRYAVPRLGRHVVSLGALVAAVGLLWFGTVLSAGGGWVPMAPGLFLGGVGTVCVIGPSFMFAGTGVTARDAGAASGSCNAAVQLGGALGTALLAVWLFAPLASAAAKATGAGGTSGGGSRLERLVAGVPAAERADLFTEAFWSYTVIAVGGLLLVAVIAQALPKDTSPYAR
ncbi:MFS transporter [Streptomyces iconiensis]|uniref:MFS transporter n=1 Tax=Streptomyces iconiensis TaxID=1384038 RepID=A0ABT6ZY50_9ACTN|nr:MFS transporter [Streptomyces iconiensis]MDJ1133999.1 MFS transporter [Streptomyces iconiensis]